MQVTRVLAVMDLVHNVYRGRLHLSKTGPKGATDELDIDARPSDAINMAVRFNAPMCAPGSQFRMLWHFPHGCALSPRPCVCMFTRQLAHNAFTGLRPSVRPKAPSSAIFALASHSHVATGRH